MKFVRQRDSMQCGASCLKMICDEYKGSYSYEELSELCSVTSEGVSMLGIYQVAKQIGFIPECRRISSKQLVDSLLPCILHWNQKHFVVLYKHDKKGEFYIADPSKGLVKYQKEEFEKHWLSTEIDGESNGLAMFLKPTDSFYNKKTETKTVERRSFNFLFGYVLLYRKYFIQIILGLLLGCLLQLIMPFLTQAIVDIGIKYNDIGLIWLVLLGELMIVTGRTATDFIRRWLLLHISMRINISLVSDFFIKLLKLPMSFFDTKLMGDLLQRIGDHSRVQNFLTGQILNVIFTFLSFIIFGVVLFFYNKIIFGVFIVGSVIYGL